MSGVAPTAPTPAAAAAAGLAAAAGRRAPDEAVRPAPAEPAATARRGPLRPDPASAQPDPDGHRGRLVDVFV